MLKTNVPDVAAVVSRLWLRGKTASLMSFLLVTFSASSLVGLTQVESASVVPDVPSPDTSGLSSDAVARIEKARQIVVVDEASAGSWAALGATCDAYKLYECAATCYRHGHILLPDDFNFAYFLAITLDQLGRGGDESVALYQQAAKIDPKYAPVHWRMGVAQERLGRMSQARDSYQRATKLDPYLVIGHRSAGLALLALGDTKNALRRLERARDISPYDGAVFEALAKAYRKSGDAERARVSADKARSLDPMQDVPDPIHNSVRVEAIGALGVFSAARDDLKDGNYSAALPKLLAYAEVDPDSADVHAYLATAYRATRQLDAARTHAMRALQLDRSSLGAYLELATIYLKQGNLEKGQWNFRQASMNAPAGAKLDEWFGDALIQAGFDDEGIASFTRAEATGRLTAKSYWMWGVVLAERSDPNAAIDRYETALSVNPNLAHAYYSLGQVYESQGRRDEAIDNYRRAVRINPRHPARERLRLLDVTKP